MELVKRARDEELTSSAAVRGIGMSDKDVESVERLELRDQGETAAEPTNLALDAGLFRCANDAGEAEERLEAETRPQRNELRIPPPFTAQKDSANGSLQIVATDRGRHAAEIVERQVVALIERLTPLAIEHPVERHRE